MKLVKIIRGLGNWSRSKTGGNGVNMSCSKGGKDFKHDNNLKVKSLLHNRQFSKAMEEKE